MFLPVQHFSGKTTYHLQSEAECSRVQGILKGIVNQMESIGTHTPNYSTSWQAVGDKVEIDKGGKKQTIHPHKMYIETYGTARVNQFDKNFHNRVKEELGNLKPSVYQASPQMPDIGSTWRTNNKIQYQSIVEEEEDADVASTSSRASITS